MGLSYSPEVGTLLGRGFADLGFEEFSVLSSKKMVSLFTGECIEIPSDYRAHFFWIPTCDEMIEQIQRTGRDIGGLIFKDQRTWELSLANGGKIGDAIRGARSLEEVLLETLIEAFGER